MTDPRDAWVDRDPVTPPLPAVAFDLLTAMQEASEEYWCASWLNDLDKWCAKLLVDEGEREWFNVPPEFVERLRALHLQAGGWWTWDASAPRLGYPYGIPVRFVPNGER